jgi:DNA-binding NarL/FixJ family response regulator
LWGFINVGDILRFVIADDHPLYLEALQGQIERNFPQAQVRGAKSLDDALALLAEDSADLVMLDLSMPGMDGLAGVSRAVAAAGSTPVVIMSGVAGSAEVRACVEAGAKGFLPKTLDGKVFTSAIMLVSAGGTYVPAEFVSAPVAPAKEEAAGAPGSGSFTPREMEVLTLIVSGASNKEIARHLDLQEVTVKLHLTRIFQKMGVKNRSHAAVLAVRSGLVPEG